MSLSTLVCVMGQKKVGGKKCLYQNLFIYCLKYKSHLFKIIESESVVLHGCLYSRFYVGCETLAMYVHGWGQVGRVINSQMDILSCKDKDSIGQINRPYQPPVKLLITLFSLLAFFFLLSHTCNIYLPECCTDIFFCLSFL